MEDIELIFIHNISSQEIVKIGLTLEQLELSFDDSKAQALDLA